jgi:hypothetical protein
MCKTLRKHPDQPLDPSFVLPKVTVAVQTSLLSCRKAGKARICTSDREPSGESRLKTIWSRLMHAAGLFKKDKDKDILPVNHDRIRARWQLGHALAKIERQQEARTDKSPTPASLLRVG